MLYDPKWKVKTKRPTMAGLIEWLQSQPDEIYDYLDNENCLMCQYLRHIGISRPSVGGEYWRDKDTREEHPIDETLAGVLSYFPHTKAAALERARAALVTDI